MFEDDIWAAILHCMEPRLTVEDDINFEDKKNSSPIKDEQRP